MTIQVKKTCSWLTLLVLFLAVISFGFATVVQAQSEGGGTNSGSGSTFEGGGQNSFEGGGSNPSATKNLGTNGSGTLTNPFTFSTVQEFTAKILDIIIKVGWVLAFFFIIYSGFLFVTAAGSEDQIKKAKMTFLWTVIGVAIVLGAKVISDLLQNTVTSVVQIK